MAGRPIQIDITSDTSGVESGIAGVADKLETVETAFEGVEDAAKSAGDSIKEQLGDGADAAGDEIKSSLEKAEDALDDVGDAAKDAGKKLENELEDGADAASDAAKEIDRDFTKALESIGNEASAAGKEIGSKVKRGTDEASEGMEELKDEANSTAKEAAASFDGSAESMIDAMQEVAANAFAGFGPAGALAGLAVAAGIGIAIGKMQELAEANDEAQQRVVDVATSLSDLGGVIDNMDLAGKIKDWGREIQGDNWLTFWVDESETNFQKFGKYAEKAGIDWETSVKGMKGSADDSKKFLEGTEKAWHSLTAEIEAGTSITDEGTVAMDESAHAAKAKRDALDQLRGEARKNIEVTEEAIEIYELEEGAIAGTNEELHRQIELKNELSDAAKNAEETELDYIDTMEESKKTLSEAERTMDKHTEAGRENRRTALEMIEATNDYNQAQAEAGEEVEVTNKRMREQKEALIDQLAPFFGSKKAAEEYVEAMLKTPERIDTDVNLNGIPDAEEELNRFTGKYRGTTIDVRADTSSADYAIAQLNGRRVQVHVDAVPRMGQNFAT